MTLFATAPLAYSIGTSFLQVALLALGGPLLLGLMDKLRARAEGRRGASVLQPLRDIRKLMTKERLHAHFSSAVLPLAPIVLLVATVVATAITPLASTQPTLAPSADIYVIVYLLLTGSIALALAGLDTGTAFGGMGSSRAMTISALAEPALLVAVLALSIQARTSNVPAIISRTLSHPTMLSSPTRLLALVAILIVVIAETGRLPVDNPSTHLELTMIHEAMILEYAGPELGLVTVASAMRLALLFALVANLFIPWGIATNSSLGSLAMGSLWLVIKTSVIAVGVSFMEVHRAKLRLFRVPELLAGGFVLSVLAVVTGLVTR
ncbi:MAG: formate hydrogenlyase [Acidobacteria bacterium]|nr:formate hydrogenlyase [Acidobacteriota bacterium]